MPAPVTRPGGSTGGNITLTMIKPYAVQNGYAGPILARINEAGFRIKAMKYVQLTLAQAEHFYEMHKGKPFFESMTHFMCSGPIIVAILEKEDAVEAYRSLIGTTDPRCAGEGTLRHLFGASMMSNAVHGSDSDENACREADFFFSWLERF